MNTDRLAARFAATPDRYVHVVLIVVAAAVRLPFWRTFQFVTYDGTYYLTQARALFAGQQLPNGFPLGFPFFVGLVRLVCGDLVVAAQLVSFLAGLGAVACLYALARHFVRREYAALGALLLAVNPLFIRYSLLTMTEALSVFLVLLGLLLYMRKRFVPCGLVCGLAAVTRPELGLVAAALAFGKLRRRGPFLALVLSFATVYTLNVAAISRSAGRPVLLNKTDNFMLGRGVSHTLLLDERVDHAERAATRARALEDAPIDHPVVYYAKRLPGDLALLVRHLLPVILLLAVLGLWKQRPLVLTAPLLFLPLMPLFAPRTEARFILPYIPALLVYALLGLAALRPRLRAAALVLVVASAVAWPFVNRATLAEFVDEALIRDAREMAASVGDGISAEEIIADRKPFLAFHAGARFELLPAAPYERTLQFLYDEGCDYLALRKRTIRHRPALKPLLDDAAVLLGETRLRVLAHSDDGDVFLKVNPQGDPLRRRKLPAVAGTLAFPAWSADGHGIAFVAEDAAGHRRVGLVDLETGRVAEIAGGHEPADRISWSPDGRRLALSSTVDGNREVVIVTPGTGEMVCLTRNDGADHSPSWSPADDWIAFVSNRTGRDEIWLKSPVSSESRQLTTDGGNAYPVFSPDGRRLAWIKPMTGVVILELATGRLSRPDAPRVVQFPPAWSPDGRYLAVTAADWGSWDVYLVRTDGTAALLLTKTPGNEGMPDWSPDGRSLAIVSSHDGDQGLWRLDGLEPYLARLEDPQAYLIE